MSECDLCGVDKAILFPVEVEVIDEVRKEHDKEVRHLCPTCVKGTLKSSIEYRAELRSMVPGIEEVKPK